MLSTDQDNLVFDNKFLLGTHCFVVYFRDKIDPSKILLNHTIIAISRDPVEAYKFLADQRVLDKREYANFTRDVVLLDSFNVDAEQYCKEKWEASCRKDLNKAA